MYEQHFGLASKPFSLIPDPAYLFFSQKHKTAFAMLEYGLLEQNGITVITGEVGIGKTTLTRHLLRRIRNQQLTVGLISNTHRSLGDLHQWIAMSLNIPHNGLDKVSLFRSLQEFLIKEYGEGRRVVIIIDEAQNMDNDLLEELRLLSNINADEDQLIQLILVGQPELKQKLMQPEMSQVAQRVSAEYHLNPLDFEETSEYVRHRIRVAGGDPHIFDTYAMVAIFYFSGGIPRLVNTLCDYALLHAYALGVHQVDLNIALEVIKGKEIGGINRNVGKTQEAEKVRSMLEKMTGVNIAEVFS